MFLELEKEAKIKQQELRRLRKFARELVKDPIACRKLLYQAGITTKTGRLRKKFR